jgi:hypothetical protein
MTTLTVQAIASKSHEHSSSGILSHVKRAADSSIYGPNSRFMSAALLTALTALLTTLAALLAALTALLTTLSTFFVR